MRLRWIAVLGLVLFLWLGCSRSDQSVAERAVTETELEQIEEMTKKAEQIIEQEMDKIQKAEAATYPCSVFPQEELETLIGNPLEKGSYTFVHRSENDREYRSESCSWSAKGAEGNEVSLWVSRAKHFDSGQVICYPPLGAGANNPWAPKRIAGIGDEAWWEYQTSGGIGTLRACSANALVETRIDLTGDDDTFAQHAARTVAEKILAIP